MLLDALFFDTTTIGMIRRLGMHVLIKGETMSSSLVRSWALTPGISSIQRYHHQSPLLITGVKESIESVYRGIPAEETDLKRYDSPGETPRPSHVRFGGHLPSPRGIRTIRDNHPLHLRYADSGAMVDAGLRDAIQLIKTAFPVSEVYIFGSYARGEERPDSDIDVLVVCTDVPQDLFDLTYQIRKHLHDRVDLAPDLIVTTDHEFEKRGSQPRAVEYTVRAEGIAV